jgi:hypothetical protein
MCLAGICDDDDFRVLQMEVSLWWDSRLVARVTLSRLILRHGYHDSNQYPFNRPLFCFCSLSLFFVLHQGPDQYIYN